MDAAECEALALAEAAAESDIPDMNMDADVMEPDNVLDPG